jgi:hypothetical protein
MKFFLKFKIFELIEEHGLRVLHIPPYHYHLNPTELVWSQTKGYYSSKSWQNMFRMEKSVFLSERINTLIIRWIYNITVMNSMYSAVQLETKFSSIHVLSIYRATIHDFELFINQLENIKCLYKPKSKFVACGYTDTDCYWKLPQMMSKINTDIFQSYINSWLPHKNSELLQYCDG